MNTTAEQQLDSQRVRLTHSIHEIALMLGVCNKSIRCLVLRGLIRPSHPLRHLLIARDELEWFLRQTGSAIPPRPGRGQ